MRGKIFTYKYSIKRNISDIQKESRSLDDSQVAVEQVKELSARMEEQKELIENLQTDRYRDKEEQKDVVKLLTGELSKTKNHLQTVEIESRHIKIEINDLRNTREWNIATLTELPVNRHGKFQHTTLLLV